MLGLVLLYVGAVLFINGLAALGKIDVREAAIMNVFTGVVSFIVSFYNGFSGDPILIQSCAYGLLFSFTYLWVAYNTLSRQDGRGLGWFSLFVAITVVFITIEQYQSATTFSAYWIATCWASWAVLWACFFVIGALQKTSWSRPVAYLTLVQAVATAWLPGYLLLSQNMP